MCSTSAVMIKHSIGQLFHSHYNPPPQPPSPSSQAIYDNLKPWWHILHCYSLVKINFASNCTCVNNQWIGHQNASTLCSRDATNQLWRCHSVKSEKIVLGDNGEMNDWWLFLVDLYVPGIKYHIRNEIMYGLREYFLSPMRRFGNNFHSHWKSLPGHLTPDKENLYSQ